MTIISQKRRTWKRAPVKKAPNFIKENTKQKIEKTIHNEESALLITYKKEMTLKNLIYLKKATDFLHKNDLPFSQLLSFDRTPKGYRGIWSFCSGKNKPVWSVDEFAAFGEFLGKMHAVSKGYSEVTLQKLPLLLTLREKYEEIKDFIPQSFDQIPQILDEIEKRWPLYLTTGLVHTDLFAKNILFKKDKVSGILQNHSLQIDVLLYDITSVIKSLYFSPCENIQEKASAFFFKYNETTPLNQEELKSLPILTSAKLLHNALNFIHTHLNDRTYKESHLNSAAISLIHAEKALHLFQ